MELEPAKAWKTAFTRPSLNKLVDPVKEVTRAELMGRFFVVLHKPARTFTYEPEPGQKHGLQRSSRRAMTSSKSTQTRLHSGNRRQGRPNPGTEGIPM